MARIKTNAQNNIKHTQNTKTQQTFRINFYLCVCVCVFRMFLFYDLYCVNLTGKMLINNSVADWCHLASAAGTVLGRSSPYSGYLPTSSPLCSILISFRRKTRNYFPTIQTCLAPGQCCNLIDLNAGWWNANRNKCHHKYGQKSLLPKKLNENWRLL